MPQFSVNTIAEVSVALAGFSGLAAAFRTRQMRDWAEWERIWFWYILTWSLGSLLFALLPGVLDGLRVSPATSWVLCNVGLAAFILGAVGYGARRGLRLHRSGVSHPRAVVTSLALLPAIAAALLLVASLAASGPPAQGAFQLGLFITVGLACGSFFLFLQHPLSEQDTE